MSLLSRLRRRPAPEPVAPAWPVYDLSRRDPEPAHLYGWRGQPARALADLDHELEVLARRREIAVRQRELTELVTAEPAAGGGAHRSETEEPRDELRTKNDLIAAARRLGVPRRANETTKELRERVETARQGRAEGSAS